MRLPLHTPNHGAYIHMTQPVALKFPTSFAGHSMFRFLKVNPKDKKEYRPMATI